MKLYTWTNAAFIAALAFAGSPAFADNCTGEFKNMMAAGDALPSSGGQKVSWFTLTPDVTSPDTGYNGSGECVGYVREMPDEKPLCRIHASWRQPKGTYGDSPECRKADRIKESGSQRMAPANSPRTLDPQDGMRT